MSKPIDLTGSRVNSLYIKKRNSVRTGHGVAAHYDCVCTCGKEVVISSQRLRNNAGISCGDIMCKSQAMTKQHVGRVFKHLTVVSFVEKVKKKIYFNCKCECGEYCVKDIYSVIRNKNLSCGCKTSHYLSINNIHKNKPAVNRKQGIDHLIQRTYNVYKKRASDNSMPFDIDLNTFYNLSQCNCTYCGEPPNTSVKNSDRNRKFQSTEEYKYNGLDRVDSSKGYSICNIVACCKICNYMKRHHDLSFFKDHITKIYKKMNN